MQIQEFSQKSVPFFCIEDEEVLTYFRNKRDELSWRMVDSTELRKKYIAGEIDDQGFVDQAVKLEVMPPVCSEHENWDGRKCKDYCDVAHVCKMVGDNRHLSPPPKKGDDFGEF